MVLTLLALAVGPHLAGAVVDVVRLSGGSVPDEARRIEDAGRLVGLAGAAVWLLWLILTEAGPAGRQFVFRRGRAESAGWPWRQVAAFVGALAVIAADENGEFASGVSTQIAGHLAELVIWVWLCALAAARCGVTLEHLRLASPKKLFGKRTQAESVGKAQRNLVFFGHAAAICAAVFLMGLVKVLPGPVLEGNQAAAAGVPDRGPLLAHAVWSATVEEVLVTAVVVAVLTAARRPLWEALTVAALMRALPHLYLGLWPALALVPLGVTAGWLYHRYRRVIPLVLAHATYNVVNILFTMPPLPLLCAVMLAGAGLSWLDAREAPALTEPRN
ncbi:lysostaphin resistance A-like protein [Streptomyces collinus]|uniref:lysostaphin resistance A-like protein n=1 Tax=Streptomyces collinus TaxID=42684 RepID=UPI0037CCC587